MAKGGKRIGAGRKKHGKNATTITREAALKHFNERVAKSTDILFNSAKVLAVGQTYIYRLDEEVHQKKDGTKYTIKTPNLVTDPVEISEAIDVLECDGENERYYYATTKPGDIRAIDSLMSRTYGRSKETVELSGEIKGLVGLITSLNDGDK